jgi:outer membrane cobalamin receptor
MEAFRAPKPWDYNWGVGNSHLQPEEIHSLELNSNFQLHHTYSLKQLCTKTECIICLLK